VTGQRPGGAVTPATETGAAIFAGLAARKIGRVRLGGGEGGP